MKVLDVTLRDGGNRHDFHFTEEDLQHILLQLDNASLDYIEIGYRNGAIAPIPNMGVAGFCASDYVRYCRTLVTKTALAVMAHPKNIACDDLKELKREGVDLLRLCVSKGGLQDACPLIAMAQDEGLLVSVNFIHISHYREEALDEVMDTVCPLMPDMIYFADSNGSLLPDRVTAIYRKYTKAQTIPLGFHAHDNLGLAQMNTLAALDAGATFVDASLSGMGKGTGNLRTEFFVAYLHALGEKKYGLDALLPGVNYVRQRFDTEALFLDRDEFIRGIFDLSTAEMRQWHRDEEVVSL